VRRGWQIRARVWPLLLGVDSKSFDLEAYQTDSVLPHRDSSVVECDVARSLWSYTEGARIEPSFQAVPSLCIIGITRAMLECIVWSRSRNALAGWNDDDRAVKRAALRRVLNAVVCSRPGGVFYYQGLHDVAAVLLFVAGEKAAYTMLSHLAVCQLRDCTRCDTHDGVAPQRRLTAKECASE
jgi:Rab-GTPase-TBC domain